MQRKERLFSGPPLHVEKSASVNREERGRERGLKQKARSQPFSFTGEHAVYHQTHARERQASTCVSLQSAACGCAAMLRTLRKRRARM